MREARTGDSAGMRNFLVSAPGWLYAVVTGMLFGIPMIFVFGIGDGRTVFAIAYGVVSGILFGAGMAFATRKQRHEARVATASVPEANRSAAHRAVWRGPAPADPTIRAAALRLAEQQLRSTLRSRTAGVIIFTLGLGLAIANLFREPDWHDFLMPPLFALLLLGHWYWPKRLRSRIALLQEVTKVGMQDRNGV